MFQPVAAPDVAGRRIRSNLGRPVVTSRSEIEAAAFALFAQRGFNDTTLEMIAAEVGVGRRTISRYFPSKNDIPWGQFDESIDDFRLILASKPYELPLHRAVHEGVLAFNDFPDEVLPVHRQRMELILTTPALQAHSVHQYAAWRRVISDFVAARLNVPADSLRPRVVGHVSLALAISAYEQWLGSDTETLRAILDEAMSELADHIST